VRNHSITSTSTSTQARPTLVAGNPSLRIAAETVSGVVLRSFAASLRVSVFTGRTAPQ
jgi:hypothetical protein